MNPDNPNFRTNEEWFELCGSLRHDLDMVKKQLEEAKAEIARMQREITACAEVITCVNCSEKTTCPYAYDGYNTNGDCLASK